MIHTPRPACVHCGLPVPAARGGGPEPLFCCFGCSFAHRLALPASDVDGIAPPSTLLLRLGLGIFLTLNVMVASWLAYSREVFGDVARAEGTDAMLPILFSYLALFLCTLVVVMLGLPMLADAGGARLRLDARTLIVLGVFAAYVLSAVHTFRGEGSLYYDTAALILVIVTLGSYLEAGAKRRAASSARRLLAALPSRLRVRRGDGVEELPVEEVAAGDLVQVPPGETVPVDGEVAEGTGYVDEASLTGEARPRVAVPGERLLAGAVSVDGQLWVRAEKVGDDTVLALMERALADARAQQPPIQRLADRVAAAFVPGVALVALAVFAVRTVRGEAAAGILDALSVLLISCPCALGLAAPLACWHGLRRAAEHGILIDSAATLERAAGIDRLFFDKTGTLTRPRLGLERTVIINPGIDERRALELAAALESASRHPIALAVLDLASCHGVSAPPAEGVTAVPGLGIEGRVEGRLVRLGSAVWAKRLGLDEHHPLSRVVGDDVHPVFLMDEAHLLARFDLCEEVRPEAAPAISELRRLGVEVGVLSGDRPAANARLAENLGIPAEGGLLPADKLARLAAARGRGERVAMVGDGVNDVPILAAADVGIAVGSASDLARRSAGVRLLGDGLDRVPRLLKISRDVRWRIRANLLWAFGFNSIGIVLAAFGALTPVFAAIAMVLSSLTVVRVSSGAGGRLETPPPLRASGGEGRAEVLGREVAPSPLGGEGWGEGLLR